MAIPRPDLLKDIGELVGHAFKLQDDSAFTRMLHDEASPDVVVCLGPGRCLFSARNAAQRHCPFCKVMPNGFGGRERAAELVRQMVVGN